MHQYKVLFKDNKANYASLIAKPFDKYLIFNQIDGERVIESFIVWGHDEQYAIDIANKVGPLLLELI